MIQDDNNDGGNGNQPAQTVQIPAKEFQAKFKSKRGEYTSYLAHLRNQKRRCFKLPLKPP